jgi:hypothetical protein
MALLTTLEKLENVQNAIAKAEQSQAYGIAGRSKTMANLETLYKREKDLIAQYNREQRGGGSIRLQVGMPNR